MTPIVMANLQNLRLLELGTGMHFVAGGPHQRAKLKILSIRTAILPAWLHLPDLAVLRIWSPDIIKVFLKVWFYLQFMDYMRSKLCH